MAELRRDAVVVCGALCAETVIIVWVPELGEAVETEMERLGKKSWISTRVRVCVCVKGGEHNLMWLLYPKSVKKGGGVM